MTWPCSIAPPRRRLAPRLDHERHQSDQQRPGGEDIGIEHRHAERFGGHVEQRQDRVVEQQAAEDEQRDQALLLCRRLLRQVDCFSCSRIAGFSSVETSCVISSPLAIERSSRRMILPERVLGRLSPNRMSFGLSLAPISVPPHSRSSLAIFNASSPLGRGPFSTTKAHTASPVSSSGRPTTAASATSFEFATSADSISIVPRRCPETFSTSSIRPMMRK